MTEELTLDSFRGTQAASQFGTFISTVLENPYIHQEPTDKQAELLMLPHLEVLFGGAAGGGKSRALLYAAYQYAEVPGYSAIIFRRTYKDLAEPGAIMDQAKQDVAVWRSMGLGAKWNNGDSSITFPSGARVLFLHIGSVNDVYNYQGAGYQFIGWDELTQFIQFEYRYLFRSLRRTKGTDVPLRVRCTSNPGGKGHQWVKSRFVDNNGQYATRLFLPSRLEDNPHLSYEEYVQSLKMLDPVTRAQQLRGDWTARQTGGLFRREWFGYVDEAPEDCQWVRFWDLAASEPKPGHDPDYTVGCLMGRSEVGQLYIADFAITRGTPAHVERFIRRQAIDDGQDVDVAYEQEPGSAGPNTTSYYARRVLPEFAFTGVPAREMGDMQTRAGPLSSDTERGDVFIIDGCRGLEEAMDQLEPFPEGVHDDVVSAATGCRYYLSQGKSDVDEDLAGAEDQWDGEMEMWG